MIIQIAKRIEVLFSLLFFFARNSFGLFFLFSFCANSNSNSNFSSFFFASFNYCCVSFAAAMSAQDLCRELSVSYFAMLIAIISQIEVKSGQLLHFPQTNLQLATRLALQKHCAATSPTKQVRALHVLALTRFACRLLRNGCKLLRFTVSRLQRVWLATNRRGFVRRFVRKARN